MSTSSASIKRRAAQVLGGAVLAGLFGVASQASAALITFDVIAIPTGTTNATVSPDGKTVTVTAPSANVNFQLWANVLDTDGNHANDSVLLAGGSVLSSNGGLQGNIVNGTPTAPFKAVGYATGVQANLDTDTDMDWGSNVTAGSPSPIPYLTPVGGSTTPIFGDASALVTGWQTVPGITRFRLGTFSWQQTGPDGTTAVNFRPQIHDGPGTAANTIFFDSDNPLATPDENLERPNYVSVAKQLPGNDANVAVGLPVNITAGAIPEPAAISLLGIGALGLLARRRRA